jgi:hypothetical protein
VAALTFVLVAGGFLFGAGWLLGRYMTTGC